MPKILSYADSLCSEDINALSFKCVVFSLFLLFLMFLKIFMFLCSQVIGHYLLYYFFIVFITLRIVNSDSQLWLHFGITWKPLKTADVWIPHLVPPPRQVPCFHQSGVLHRPQGFQMLRR